ncbi:GNAT family N-acetyltransferase [Staphylococcus gallinarum]|uniref:GNAT family N-acetyltransferase n=1 Tax=Staphylococcus gallinarum TaxID=1293 RepID=UPI001E5FF638|nr:GNAT family N-acetyltransferase [Staphylococcus gallinarum]MCD8827997.1 GNAT family N-acetyltransferase [Staphylococcus gallinarum]MEB6055216.1 GNAT family N-acetyltransferase [Staphylococcus gallinarum]
MYYEQNKVPTEKELKELYHSVGWFNYLTDEFTLTTLLNQSSFFITVKDNEQLIGLIRVITDDISIVYIQDLIVLPAYQRHGIGSELLNQVLNSFQHIRQIVLLTDNEQTKRKFYEKLGLFDVSQNNCLGFMKLNTI